MATPAKVAKPEAKNGENADDQAGKKYINILSRSVKNFLFMVKKLNSFHLTFTKLAIAFRMLARLGNCTPNL